MKYAIIENGKVANIVLSEQPLGPNWFLATDDAEVGGGFANGVFTSATPDLDAEREAMVCTRRQGLLALGPTLWTQTEALLASMEANPDVDPATVWALKVAIYHTQEWRRLDQDMAALIWALDLTPEQADDLFRRAMAIE